MSSWMSTLCSICLTGGISIFDIDAISYHIQSLIIDIHKITETENCISSFSIKNKQFLFLETIFTICVIEKILSHYHEGLKRIHKFRNICVRY